MDDKAIVNEVFRKNLSKLKKQFYKLSEQGVEEKVMSEILDSKDSMLNKIKNSMNKMSKKMLIKIMDYINLKFRIALTKNKINVKQDKFVQESDILDIYEKLKTYPKPTKSKQNKLVPNKSFENIKKPGTFGHLSSSLGDFAEDV